MPRVIAVLFCPKQIRDNCSTIRAVGDFINLPLHANKKKKHVELFSQSDCFLIVTHWRTHRDEFISNVMVSLLCKTMSKFHVAVHRSVQ